MTLATQFTGKHPGYLKELIVQGQPIKNWRAGGTPNLSGWTLGERVTDISQVKLGDILLQDSIQFDALNLCRVDEFPGFPEGITGSRLYAVFVDPTDTSCLRNPGDSSFCVWDHDFDSPSGNLIYYRVSKASVSGDALKFNQAALALLNSDDLLVNPNELFGYAASAALKELIESWTDAVRNGAPLERLIGDIDAVTETLNAFKTRALAIARNATTT